jgi:hypothetical protein
MTSRTPFLPYFSTNPSPTYHVLTHRPLIHEVLEILIAFRSAEGGSTPRLPTWEVASYSPLDMEAHTMTGSLRPYEAGAEAMMSYEGRRNEGSPIRLPPKGQAGLAVALAKPGARIDSVPCDVLESEAENTARAPPAAGATIAEECLREEKCMEPLRAPTIPPLARAGLADGADARNPRGHVRGVPDPSR